MTCMLTCIDMSVDGIKHVNIRNFLKTGLS